MYRKKSPDLADQLFAGAPPLILSPNPCRMKRKRRRTSGTVHTAIIQLDAAYSKRRDPPAASRQQRSPKIIRPRRIPDCSSCTYIEGTVTRGRLESIKGVNIRIRAGFKIEDKTGNDDTQSVCIRMPIDQHRGNLRERTSRRHWPLRRRQ